MGNESSVPLPDGDEELEPFMDALYCGFRVLGIQDQSPAAKAGFVSFLDFILEANGIRLDTKDSTLMELIAQNEETPMALKVYNIKSQTTRDVVLTPSRKWAGKGLLGVTIRFDSYEGAEDQLLHVLHVTPASPAACAGLQADTDYLLGTPERLLRNAEDLHDVLLDSLEDSFQCYVYNTMTDQVRIVSIAPSEHWGGDGVLGAEVAHGVLHRLPGDCRKTNGSSVGYVSLSKDAIAATDPFLRSERLPSTQERQHEPRADQNVEDVSDVSLGGNAAVPSASAATAVDCAEPSQLSVPEPAQTPAPVSQDPLSASAQDLREIAQHQQQQQQQQQQSALPASTAPASKPRFTARTDHRFPMSTVAVLAEP